MREIQKRMEKTFWTLFFSRKQNKTEKSLLSNRVQKVIFYYPGIFKIFFEEVQVYILLILRHSLGKKKAIKIRLWWLSAVGFNHKPG